MRIIMAMWLCLLLALPAEAFTLDTHRYPGFSVGFPETWITPFPFKNGPMYGLESKSPDGQMWVEVFQVGDRPMPVDTILDEFTESFKTNPQFYPHCRPRHFTVAGRKAAVRVYSCQRRPNYNWRKYLFGVVETNRGGIMVMGSVADSVVPSESAYDEDRLERFLAIVRSVKPVR